MAQQIQKADYPDIELWNTNIDAQMMWLTKNPENYGVIVAGNMFGDIVSDGFAGLIGGLDLPVAHSIILKLVLVYLNPHMVVPPNMPIIQFQLLIRLLWLNLPV